MTIPADKATHSTCMSLLISIFECFLVNLFMEEIKKKKKKKTSSVHVFLSMQSSGIEVNLKYPVLLQSMNAWPQLFITRVGLIFVVINHERSIFVVQRLP